MDDGSNYGATNGFLVRSGSRDMMVTHLMYGDPATVEQIHLHYTHGI